MARTLALPISLAPDGSLASLGQGTPDELAQSVAMLIDTRPGERTALPTYGTPDPLGAGVDAGEIVAQVAEWEDRVATTDVDGVVRAAIQDRVRSRSSFYLQDGS